MKKLSLFALFAILLASPALYAAKIYKWVDKDGSVNYSSLPPDNNARELKNIKSEPSTPANAPVDRSESRQKFLEGIAKDREEKAKAEEQAAAEQKVRDENCTTARKNLATLRLGGRQFEMSADGERRYLEDEETQARIKQNEDYVKEWCGEPQ